MIKCKYCGCADISVLRPADSASWRCGEAYICVGPGLYGPHTAAVAVPIAMRPCADTLPPPPKAGDKLPSPCRKCKGKRLIVIERERDLAIFCKLCGHEEQVPR